MPYIPLRDTGLADDSQALAREVERLGGEIVEHKNFRFEIPLADARRVVTEINKNNLRCIEVGQRQGNDFNGKACSIVQIQVNRPPPPSEYSTQRNLMYIATRPPE